MRIGFIIYGSLDTLSGGYLYDRIVIRGLEQLDHDVEVISLPGGSYTRRLGLGLSPGLCRRLAAGDRDILIQDELCHPTLAFFNRRLRGNACPPLVALVHHALCEEPHHRLPKMFMTMVERRYLTSVDGFIFNSETTRRSVAKLVGQDRHHVIAYPAGDRFEHTPSIDKIGGRALQPGALELLFLGNMVPRKGLLPLLKALAEVDRSAWRLSVAGSPDFDPSYAAEARRMAGELGLIDNVRFAGSVSDDGLIALLNTCHLLCMPYAYEGFGIAILEAMAFGLPAIGSLSGAAGEIIEHGANGFLLPPDDLAGLRPLLLNLHRDREHLRLLAFAARETYAKRPNWQDAIRAIDGFLQEMVEVQVGRKAGGLVKCKGAEQRMDRHAP
jgi:glycosyltransferase involved in cell wall biosynthesis